MASSVLPLNHSLRDDFPILAQLNRGRPLIYLDSAASAQKPQPVIDAIAHFYQQDYANIHRGIYELSARSTACYEKARRSVQRFINARSEKEIVFVKGTTEAINLVATTFAQADLLRPGDEVIISALEHHANIVPWLMLKDRLGINVKIIPVNDDGSLDLTTYPQLFSSRTQLVAISHVSNALGTINDIQAITEVAHSHQVPVLVDGAQAVPHLPVDVSALGCDFYAFSAHKLYGPSGIGVLYAKSPWLEKLPPYQGGGDMIETVSLEAVTFAKAPQKFEAGTPNIAGAAGLTAAIHYLEKIGLTTIYEHEQALLNYAEECLQSVEGLRVIGTAHPKVGVISFVIEGIHPHDLGTILDDEGIAVRAGHHCAMPLMHRFNVPATVRASFGLYTTDDDIDALIKGLSIAVKLFKH